MWEQSKKRLLLCHGGHVKYVVVGGVALWILFCIARSLVVASHRADEQMREFMQIGEDENGVYERS